MTENEVPKLIHHMWLDKKNINKAEPPLKYVSNGFITSWKVWNPDYDYIFWSARRVNDELLTKTYFKGYKKFYEKLHIIEKCDFARYMVMYEYGGFYSDLDFRLIDSLEKIRKDVKEIMLFYEASEHYYELFFKRISTSVLISIPKQEFWLKLLNSIKKHYSKLKTPHANTGPFKLASFFESHYKSAHPEWIGNKCLFMAFTDTGRISKDCFNYIGITAANDNNSWKYNVNKINNLPYRKMMGFSLWKDGTNWHIPSAKTDLSTTDEIKQWEKYWKNEINKEILLKDSNLKGAPAEETWQFTIIILTSLALTLIFIFSVLCFVQFQRLQLKTIK